MTAPPSCVPRRRELRLLGAAFGSKEYSSVPEIGHTRAKHVSPVLPGVVHSREKARAAGPSLLIFLMGHRFKSGA